MLLSKGRERVRAKFPFDTRSGLVHDPAGETTPQRVASYSLIAVSTVVTFLAAWYIYRELNRAKPAVIYERRKARYILLLSFILETQHSRTA